MPGTVNLSKGIFTQPTLICDLDGVVTDFIGSFLSYLELDNLVWPKGEYDLKKVTGHDTSCLTYAFWDNVRLYPEGRMLIEMSKSVPIVFASRIHSAYECAAKFMMLQLLSDYRAVFVPCIDYKAKRFGSQGILLDDSEAEILEWKGPSVLVPRPWNHGTGNPIDVIYDTVRRLV